MTFAPNISAVPHPTAHLMRTLIELDGLLQTTSVDDQQRALALLGVETVHRVHAALSAAVGHALGAGPSSLSPPSPP
jgi:hypothetical protein